MTRYLLFSLLILFYYNQSQAQTLPGNSTLRSMVDTSLYPFYHGVASGDPTPNAIVLWTRVTADEPGMISGTWKIALDTNFTQIIQSGIFQTDSTMDYTVKIDVQGLQPDTWYFYEFTALGKNSLTGRTKTAPTGGMSQLRFAFVSCSNYPYGYFNVYDRIRERNDVDAVLHLGDYIYEYGTSIASVRNDQLPNYEITKLADYRQRYSTYRLDASLRKLHQQMPFISVWDDHETANNSYTLGADNHTEGPEGLWVNRKSYGQQAYEEWLPIRLPESGNKNKIFRKISYGNLADIFMLDTRLYDRSIQGGNPNDTSRHILGPEELNWLKNELQNSTATWKILGQQVMMGNLTPFGLVLNNDQWDGYAADRKKLYDFILQNNIQNVIVLTGDIHTAWAMDLPYNPATYNATTGAGSVGVEFVTTSVTSPSSPVALPSGIYDLIRLILPHIKYVDLHLKGYGVLDLTTAKAQGDFYSVPTVTQLNPNSAFQQGWYTDVLTRWLKKANAPTVKTDAVHYQAPENPRQNVTTAVYNHAKNIIVLSAYPNPFIDKVSVQFNLTENSNVSVKLIDGLGREIKYVNLGNITKGLHNEVLNFDNIAKGNYRMLIYANDNFIEKGLVKF